MRDVLDELPTIKLTFKEKMIGYPYGTLPRLLLFWITREALRTNSPRIELGNSLAKFMEELGERIRDPHIIDQNADVKTFQETVEVIKLDGAWRMMPSTN